MEIRGKVCLVTGGGTGIGRAVAELFAELGAAGVVVTYTNSRDEAEAAASDLAARGCASIARRADVRDEAAVAAVLDETIDRWGRLDVLVNNAGTTALIPFRDLDAVDDETWHDILDVNLLGTFRCSRLAAPHLREAKGAIVNVGSTAGVRASGSSLPYAVSKAAVHHLTRCLAVSMAPEVRVNAVAPGTVSTRWYRRLAGDDEAERAEADAASRAPLGGVATPSDCARAVVGLLASDWVTGEVVLVDGGTHLLY